MLSNQDAVSNPLSGKHLKLMRWVFALALALLVYNVVDLYHVVDDSYITYRYIDNLIAGNGLVFNIGERVEGYTNFLWLVALLPFRLVGIGPELASLALSICSLGSILFSVYHAARHLAGSDVAGWAATVLAMGSPQLARWCSSGMETVFFAALIAAANHQLIARGGHSRRSSVLYGLAVLARPPGVLHGAVSFCVAALRIDFWRNGAWRRAVMLGALFAALPLTHLLFRWLYYDAWLPNTYYAKLGGDLPNLIPFGWDYVWGYLLASGWVLLLPAVLGCAPRRKLGWLSLALLMQIVVHASYVVYAGGDFFTFHRFLVPIIPALTVLAGVGLWSIAHCFGDAMIRVLPIAALLCAVAQTVLAQYSTGYRAIEQNRSARKERELVAQWLTENYPRDAVLAINAAGLVPYRTGMPTIDMLGLNDRHIARSVARMDSQGDGASYVGHFKHDGRYVCSRSPDIVLTVGAVLHRGRSVTEAEYQSALNTFIGDREFLRAPACVDRYAVVAEELLPGRYVVAYVRQEGGGLHVAHAEGDPQSAREWFERGLGLMRRTQLREAIEAFERSIRLDPTNAVARVNRAYCHLDLREYEAARAQFAEIFQVFPENYDALYGLAMSSQRLGMKEDAVMYWRRYVAGAPDSPWKERAREALRLMGSEP
jgi:tetratricopeptide (TPR) repeat protein